MQIISTLYPGHYYHIYNRGNNGENLFYEDRNYSFFLRLYTRYIDPIADTFAYCLMRNHFHLLVRIKSSGEAGIYLDGQKKEDSARHFSNLFNAYAKAINKAYRRTGSLFEERFKRIEVTSDAYFLNLIFYIHFNPQKHGFVADFRDWPWSSFNALVCEQPTRLQRSEVIDWFGDVNQFLNFHRGHVDEGAIAAVLGDELVR